MLESAPVLGRAGAFRFDLVQVARQSLADLSVDHLNKAVKA